MAFLTAQCILVLVLGINVALIHGTNFMNVGVRYKISLAAYSGNQDPEWNIDSTHPMYKEVAWAVNRRPPTRMPTGLGYCGWNVEATNMFGQRAFKTVGRHTNRQLETLLLRSCPSQQGLSASLMNHVTSGIYGYADEDTPIIRQAPRVLQAPRVQQQSHSISVSDEDNVSINIRAKRDVESYPSSPAINKAENFITKSKFASHKRKKRQAGSRCSTVFEPRAWNYGRVQRRNNCYNYATNIQTNTFAQPGRGSGRKYTVTSASDVYAAATRDGLTPLRTPDAGNQCLIALVIWPGQDYHFYRLDNNGYWSQKSGRTRARNTDESLNMITDPRNADRGPYSVFAGWFGVGPGITLR